MKQRRGLEPLDLRLLESGESGGGPATKAARRIESEGRAHRRRKGDERLTAQGSTTPHRKGDGEGRTGDQTDADGVNGDTTDVPESDRKDADDL